MQSIDGTKKTKIIQKCIESKFSMFEDRERDSRLKFDIISVHIKWNELLNLNLPSNSAVSLFDIQKFLFNYQTNEWINVEWCHLSFSVILLFQ